MKTAKINQATLSAKIDPNEAQAEPQLVGVGPDQQTSIDREAIVEDNFVRYLGWYFTLPRYYLLLLQSAVENDQSTPQDLSLGFQ